MIVKLIALASLGTGAWLFGLCIVSFIEDRRKPRRRCPLDLVVIGAGLVCVVLTSLYALAAAAIWL